MERWNRLFFMLTSLVVLSAALSLTGANPATAEEPKPVAVVNTPTVNALQSGSWNVGINGSVNIGNSELSPVPVRDVDRNHRIPFQASCSGTTECSIDIPGTGTMVIEHITMEIVVQDPSRPIQTHVQTTVGNNTTPHVLVPALVGPTGTGFGIYAVSQPVHFYADAFPPSGLPSVLGHAFNFSGVPGNSFFMSIAGYIVDCGSGPGCPLP